MRMIPLAVLFSAVLQSTAPAEEAYQATAKLWAECVGQNLRTVVKPAIAMNQYLRQKCGWLEEREQQQFLDWIGSKVGNGISAEIAFTISAHMLASPSKIREGMVDAYMNAMEKGNTSKRKSGAPIDLNPH